MVGGTPAPIGLPKTLLIVAPYFSPIGGGLEMYVQHVAVRLARHHGWRVVIVTSASPRGRVTKTTEGPLVVYRLPRQFRWSNTPFSLRWAVQLRKIIRQENPSVINAHGPVPGLADLAAAVAGRIPVVVTWHAGSMKKGRPLADFAVGLYEGGLSRRLFRRADWIITSSDFVRDSFLIRMRSKCSTITPGVDRGAFTPGRSDDARVLFVGGLGRGDSHKGLDTLLRAVAKLRVDHPQAVLDVVGEGSDRERYEAQAAALGISEAVHFSGRLSGSELVAAFQRATILALPTVNDSFGMVLLEAMACAVPVVTTAVGSIPAIVDDGGNGFLVEPNDPEALAAVLARVIDDPLLAAELGRAGEKAAAERSWEAAAERTNTILEAVSVGRPGDGRRRLAVVTPYFPPHIGGLEHYAYRVAKGFDAKEDWDVVVLTSNEGARRTKIELFDGLTVHRLAPWVRISDTPISPLWPGRLRRAMIDNRIDLVNVHAPVPYMADVAAAVCGTRPVVVTYHAGSMVKNRQPADAFIRAYESWLLPRLFAKAAAVVAVSPSVRARFLEPFNGTVHVVPPAVDDEWFVPGRGPDRPTVLYVGKVERSAGWKGIPHLFDAFHLILATLGDAELVIVGGGDAIEDHLKRAGELGIARSVRFMGALRGADLLRAYQQSSVVVLPSTTDAESFGMILIEAMACGKPVIGSRIGGIPFVIDDGTDGYLVPPGDATAIAVACLGLLKDPERAAAMGQRGLDKVKRDFAWPGLVRSYTAVFDSALVPLSPGSCGSHAGSWTTRASGCR